MMELEWGSSGYRFQMVRCLHEGPDFMGITSGGLLRPPDFRGFVSPEAVYLNIILEYSAIGGNHIQNWGTFG